MTKGWTTRRQFLKAAGGLGLLAVGHPLLLSCSRSNDAPLDYSYTISEMTKYIDELMDKDKIVGAAIALVDDQRVVWSRGFGYADAVKGIRVTSDTIFPIGSTSKTFTAAMIMQLVEQKAVNLDDPLTKYIPRFAVGAAPGPYAAAGGPITIRNILTQHTGIPGDLNNGLFTSRSHPDFNSRLVDYLQGDHVQYPTDYYFAYSNTAVALLADVVAAATGTPFLDHANTFLCSLGMNHSSFSRDDPSVAVGQTRTYYGGQDLFDGYINSPATGAILSSVADMARYIQMINAGGVAENGRVILQPETLHTMLTPHNLSVPLDFDFRIGFIWWLSDPDLSYAGRIIEHGGTTNMTKTMLKIALDHKLGVILLTNSDTADPLRNTAPVKTLQLAVKEKAGLEERFSPEYSPVVAWSAEALDALAGIYIPTSAPPYWPAGVRGGKGYDRIERAGSGLAWTQDAGLSSKTTQTLVPRANGRFSSPASQDTEYEFRKVSGRDVMISYYKGFANLKAERFLPVAVRASWASRLGTYKLVNLDADDIVRTYPGFDEDEMAITLSINSEGLLLMDNLVLAPVSDIQAYRPGLARDLGAAVQIVNVNGEEQIQCLSYRYRKA
jgi:CubicO group peptidase (beta-lactamase class C family)